MSQNSPEKKSSDQTQTGRTIHPPPAENASCRCFPNMMRAFFCMTGHLTECHYPQSCAEANCAHMDRCQEED